MRGSRAAVLLMLLLLGCTGAHGSVLTPVLPARALFTVDDLPAGFAAAAPPPFVIPSWCGGAPVTLNGADGIAAGEWTSIPAPGQRATIENVVAHFKSGAVSRFLSALRADQSRCSNGVDLTTIDGVHVRGTGQALDLPLLGDGGMAIEATGGVDLPDTVEKTGGWVTRIAVQRGDSVSVVVFAVAGLDYDTGMRDRLAHLAGAKLEGQP